MRGLTSLVAAAALGAAPSAGAQSRAGTGENATLYGQICAACHGADLRGGRGSSLIDAEWRFGGSEQQIIDSITQGRGEMPAFGRTLDERQIRSLAVYIVEMKRLAERIGRPTPPDPAATTYASSLHRFRLEKVAETDTGYLWSLHFLPDGRMLAPEKNGRVWLIARDGTKSLVTGTPRVMETIDGGMMEVVPHPQYARNGWIYMAYFTGPQLVRGTPGSPENRTLRGSTRVVRGRIRDGAWTDEQTVFDVWPEHRELAGTRVGCRIVFRDGYVFFSIGDGGSKELVQDLGTPLGKVFRVHEDGRVPGDNPFVSTQGAYPQVWTYGNRNVQGMAFEPRTGLLFATEHGPRGGDELNVLRKGANYGWPLVTYGIDYDGTVISDRTTGPGIEPPLHYWVPSIATGGIDFYTGRAFAKWRGNLFVTGMRGEEFHRFVVAQGKVVEHELLMRDIGQFRDVETGPDGLPYIILGTRSPDSARIYRMVPAD